MKGILISLQFLTTIPVRHRFEMEDQTLAKAMVYFPIVGLILGGILVGVNFLALKVLPPLTVDLMLVMTLVVLTGALHLDGFADTCDALFSGKGREDMLRVMRDSRVGTMGAVGLICLLLAKFVFLSNLPSQAKIQALLLAPVIGRWSMVAQAALGSYARASGGLGRPFADYVGRRELLAASLITVAIASLTWRQKGLILMAMVSVTALLLNSYFKSKIGGITGDTLGATNEVIEVFVLFFSLTIIKASLIWAVSV